MYKEPWLKTEIQRVFCEHRGFHGSPLIHQELRAAGESAALIGCIEERGVESAQLRLR